MTPEQSQKLDELYEWMQERKRQQISYPIDDVSLIAITDRLVSLLFNGTTGGSLTQAYVDSGADTVTAPKAYAGRLKILANGTEYQVPYL
jgi:hypothetical protein